MSLSKEQGVAQGIGSSSAPALGRDAVVRALYLSMVREVFALTAASPGLPQSGGAAVRAKAQADAGTSGSPDLGVPAPVAEEQRVFTRTHVTRASLIPLHETRTALLIRRDGGQAADHARPEKGAR